MKIMALDPAGEEFGVAVLEKTPSGLLTITMKHLITAPEDWDVSKKNSYMAHAVAAMICLEKPDHVVSEKPWGMGYSKQSLTELIGAIKAETWDRISWQSVSEARYTVLGEGYGGADKKTSAEWLFQYPWAPGAKRVITSMFEAANPETNKGYDILDAIMHGLCFMISRGMVEPKHKEPKKSRKKKSEVSSGS